MKKTCDIAKLQRLCAPIAAFLRGYFDLHTTICIGAYDVTITQDKIYTRLEAKENEFNGNETLQNYLGEKSVFKPDYSDCTITEYHA